MKIRVFQVASKDIHIAPKAELETLTFLAKRQLDLHAKIKEARLESERKSIQTVIASLDAKIDEIVCKIYGLKEEEKSRIRMIDMMQGVGRARRLQ